MCFLVSISFSAERLGFWGCTYHGVSVLRAKACKPGCLRCCASSVAGMNASFAVQAYRTWLGFYKGFMKLCRWNPEQLVQAANRYAASLGESCPPHLLAAAAACVRCCAPPAAWAVCKSL